jgi:Peptidase family M28/PA domain
VTHVVPRDCRRPVLLAAFLASAFLQGGQLAAQSDLALTAARVRAHVEFLADDLLEGREAGTRGYDVAARYVAAMLRTYGLEPAGDAGTFFQQVPLREGRLSTGEIVLQPKSGAQVTLALPGDAVVVPSLVRRETHVTAPAAYVGYGITAPELKYDDYAGIDVRGKIAIVLGNAPRQFSTELRAHYSSSEGKLQNAVAHGARGVIHIELPDYQATYPWPRTVEFVGGPRIGWTDVKGQPASGHHSLEGRAYLSGDATEKLFAGAPMPLAAVYAAAAKGAARPLDLPVSVTIRTTTEHRDVPSANVAGLLKGGDAALADSYVVLTAHLDHVGTGPAVDGDRIYNGAYDNAAGCAVLLEVARRLASAGARPRRSILVVFVTAEEKGLIGSDYFARNPTVPAGSMVANVNLDMPLLQWPIADVVAFGAENSSLDAVVARSAAAAGLKMVPDPLPQENLFVRSDQYSLVKQGVPAVFLMPAFGSKDPKIDGGTIFRGFLDSHYHKPSDDLSLPMNPDAVAAFTETNYLITLEIANDPVAPSWNPGNFFGETYGRRRGAP